MPDFDYLLEARPYDEEHGQGYVVLRVSDQKRLSWQTLPRDDGLRSLPLVGERYRLENLQDRRCAPPSMLELRPEPNNEFSPHAIGVAIPGESDILGYLPDEEAKILKAQMDAGKTFECVSMWERWEHGRKVAVRVLIYEPHASVAILAR